MEKIITTVFEADSPELPTYLENNKVGRTFDGQIRSWKITKVTVEEEHSPNPFTGKMQTKIDLVLDDGQPGPTLIKPS